MTNYQERDAKHLWHPITQHKTQTAPLFIEKASGIWLYDELGNRYLDAISSWYTCVYGHCNSYINNKVQAQLHQHNQIVFTGLTHKPAIELSEALLPILPNNQTKIFFSDNGSTSVEVAVKMALQFYYNQGKQRQQIICFENAFHGDTFGAMSVSNLSVYHGAFEDYLLEVIRIPVPQADTIDSICIQLQQLLQTPTAAFIYEPLVQGANSMYMYEATHLDQLLTICKENGVLTIADEVMTGFGKTGKNFASEYMTQQPDIICLAKALTAGVVPMAITSCTQKVYDAFYADEITKGFFHGHTYSANPIACVAALASIELLQSQEIQQNIAKISAWNTDFINNELKTNPKVINARSQGVILAFDLSTPMTRYGEERNSVYNYFLSKSIYLRPLGNTIYIVPPYICTKEDMNYIYDTLLEFINKY